MIESRVEQKLESPSSESKSVLENPRGQVRKLEKI